MKQNQFTGDRDDRRHTSMDSDENDYQGQGLHLAGEESSKVSSVLCPYALPKFDFDEGSLRFDSLVENEVFLGIQSQDDNQWIEDFSRGSSGIDFSSSAPDSCSIPRHINVWSEATSSESVEMLLKSVGQEDMVLDESVIRDSNARNELPSSNQMDTNFMHDSKLGDFKESSCGTPPAQFQEDFSPLNKVEPEYISSSHGFDQPIDVCAGGVGESTITSIVVTEQNLPVDVKGDDENASKDSNLIGESLIDKIQEDNIAISSCLSSDPIAGSEIPSVQNNVPDISSENSGLPVETNIVGGHGASDTSFVLDNGQVTRSPTEMHTSVVHSTVCVASETEVWSENAVKTTSNIEQWPMLPPQGNSSLPTEQGCKSEVFSPELAKASSDGCVALTEGTGNEAQSDTKVLCGEKPCAVIKVDEGCSREESSVVIEIGNECGNEQSFAVSNNDQYIIYPELEKDSVVPKVMSGRVMDGDDVMGVHGASDSSFLLDDGQATESPTQMHTSVPAAYVAPETESLSEKAKKTPTNIEQSSMLPPQDNSTLHTEEGCKSSPDITMVCIDGCVASTEGMADQLQSESNDLCGEKFCAVIKVDGGCCSTEEQSSVVSEIGNACGNEQSFAASNNDQCFIYPELEKQSVVPKVTSDGDDDVFISSNSSKDVVHVEPVEAEPAQAEPAEAEPVEAEPAEAEPTEAEQPTEAEPAEAEPAKAEPAEAVQEPNDVISFNVPQERNDGNLTSDLVNKNSETHEVFIISCDSTQSVDDVQPTEVNSSPKPSTTTWERIDETLASESENANSERDEASFNGGDITKAVDHLESTEASPSLKLITGMSAEQDSHDRKPLNVMQKSNDESLTSDAINTNFKIFLPVDDGNNAGVGVTEENVRSTGGGPDFGLLTEGETGSHDEVHNFFSVPVGADAVVKSMHQNEDQISQTMLLEASISDNNEDKKDTATLEASMEDLDEKMKQGPDATVVTSAPALSAVEIEAKDVSQSVNLVELHGGHTNVDQIMTEVGQVPCGAESVSPPAFSTAETEANDVNLSMNIVELHGGQTNVEQVTAEVGQEPCGAASVPLHSDSVVRERDGADSGDLMNLKEGVTKGGLTLSGEVSGSINSDVEHYIHSDSAPVVSASEISSNEGKAESCMTESKDKDVPMSSDANVVVANLSSPIPSEGMKVAIEKVSSEGAEGILKEDRTFTFPAGLLPVLSGKETSPVEGSHSTYKPGQTDSKVAQGTSLGSPQMHDQRALSGGPKGTSERKTRRGSGKLAKVNPAKGNCSKEAESKIQRDVGNTLCVVLSPSATVKPMPLEAGSSAPKPTAVVAHSSNLPDLNTSTSTAVLFRQPFTDLQQVQLRAQIFVYGSLIQGVAPDEACMVSAFGTSDGGRSIWEPAWLACIQRLQKSHLSNPETPLQSHSGAKASDQVTKTGLSQRKSRVSSNGNSSSVVTPIIPLSSPLWNISTPSSDALPNNTVARSPVIDYQTLPPLHGYQTPASRKYSGHTRVSQAPFPVPWMASPQASPYNVNAHIAPPQPTEIVKLTTVKASPAPSPATVHSSLIAVGQNGQSGVVCSTSVLQETKKVAASYAPHSADPKSRKRKKVSVSEDLAQIAFPVALGRTESVSISVTPTPVNKRPALGDFGPSSLPPGVQVENAGSVAANSQFLASATISIPPGPGLKSSTEKAIAVVSPVYSVDHSAKSHQIIEERALNLDEAVKVDAKLQAEQASAHAAVLSPVVDHPASSHPITEKRALILDEVAKVDAKLQAEQASAHAAVVSRAVDHPASSLQVKEKRALSLDEVVKVEEAKLQAEQASAHAAAAVSHCQNVWSQLGKQNSSNLMSDSEAKLASAAVCIAAAASVAKAASAAAKVASTVALQAKLMADEALITNRCHDSARKTSGFANETGSATPASILKAREGGNGSSSIIYAAREAARRRVEAASAASKHAENLDAIVKAAELAAEAVAQAGKIVALGDPLPLSKLVEGGPAGYWKNTGTPFSMGTKPNIVTQNNEHTSVEEHPDPTVEQSERPLDSLSQAPVNSVSPDAIEKSKDLMEDQVKGKMAASAVTHGGELEGLKSSAASKTTKTVGVAPESESGLRFSTDENMAGIIKDSRISVSSLVEVFKDNGDLTGAWFTASVLSLKSGKALVSYKDLETDQGRLTEWVPLEAGTRKPPVIRLAHPMTSLMFDGNRKRRREVAKDYSWSVGDRVDAWLENCWSEGVVVDKNKKDDTTLSVHFPAQGKTIPVKAWHLRPSLIWTDGEWIESLSSETDKCSQGDTPKEKRMKLGSPIVDDGNGKEKISKIMDPPESRKFEESRLLPLSAKEKSFHIGSTKNDKPETQRTMRSGLQKEGPKVVFGVPKPGKKRKFMDVSKHYVSSRNTKASANIDKEKSAKHSGPEGGAYGWKYSSKVVVKEKQAAEPRTRNFKPTKPPSSFARTLPQKDKCLIPSVSVSKECFSTDNNRTDATSNDDSSDQHLTDFVSSSNIEGEEPISSSSRAPLPRAHRKMTPSNANSDRLMKGKSASAHGKPPNKVVEKEKSVTDSSEPRRSNRKIQPTSRLLEGLQSSLIMSKTPLVSHEKSHKGQKFGPPRGMRS